MIILIHTSKTMRPPAKSASDPRPPELIGKASRLATYLKTLSPAEIAKIMAISPKLATTTHDLIGGWTAEPPHQRVAIDSFLGDIYSGLQVTDFDVADRAYADDTLRILSGLYGVLRPLDGIYPYRLELGYKLPKAPFDNLYRYWDRDIADTLPGDGPIVNLAAIEYSKTVTPYVGANRIIAPSFLTASPKTGEPTFVTVHAKVARGAFAHWLIKNRIDDPDRLVEFNDIGYCHRPELSTPTIPVFVCEVYGGLGLSVRLT